MARVWRLVVGVAVSLTLLGIVLTGVAAADRPGSSIDPGVGGLSGGALVGGSQLPAGLAPAVGQVLGASADPRSGIGSPSQQELQAVDGASGDRFGISVAVSASGRVALIGAQAKDGFKGAAYVFVRRGGSWTEQQELQAADSAPGDAFGISVALSDSGRVALIGAPGAGAGNGAAYVFVRRGGSWTEQQELQAADGALFDGFGISVSLSDSVALIGAGGKGAAYVFVGEAGSYVQQQELQAADATGQDAAFGNSVAVSASGRMALISAQGVDAFKGAAYVFVRRRGRWTEQQKLQAADGAPGDRFGDSIALSASGRVALIGVPSKDGIKGAVYVFLGEEGSYTQQQELQAPDGPTGFFGNSVSLSASGRVALIGAFGTEGSTGAAFVFVGEEGRYAQTQELQAANRTGEDFFGNSVSLSASGRVMLIGADQKDGLKGAAYVFASDEGTQ
jgi:hypothetical protein